MVVLPFVHDFPVDLSGLPNGCTYADFLATAPDEPAAMHFVQLPFNHPLFITFSSGTTGVPKCIVHSAGVRARGFAHRASIFALAAAVTAPRTHGASAHLCDAAGRPDPAQKGAHATLRYYAQ